MTSGVGIFLCCSTYISLCSQGKYLTGGGLRSTYTYLAGSILAQGKGGEKEKRVGRTKKEGSFPLAKAGIPLGRGLGAGCVVNFPKGLAQGKPHLWAHGVVCCMSEYILHF